MRVKVTFDWGMTNPLLRISEVRIPEEFAAIGEVYVYLQVKFQLTVNFGLYLDGYYLPKNQSVHDLLRDRCELTAVALPYPKPVCQFFLALRTPPYGVSLVPTTKVSAFPSQA